MNLLPFHDLSAHMIIKIMSFCILPYPPTMGSPMSIESGL